MNVLEFLEEMKERASRELLEVSGTGKLTEKTYTFDRGLGHILIIRGGAIEKAAISHLALKSVTQPGIDAKADAVVFQMEVFPENPYCPMGHFNTEWQTRGSRHYYMNLDLFPAIRIEEDLKSVKDAMDLVADRFGRDRDKMREELDIHYNMEHFAAPLASKVGCKLLELMDEDLDLFISAYRAFFDAYLAIIRERKGSPCSEGDVRLKLERNGKWLEYLTLKDRAVKMAQSSGVPAELLIDLGFPPSAAF